MGNQAQLSKLDVMEEIMMIVENRVSKKERRKNGNRSDKEEDEEKKGPKKGGSKIRKILFGSKKLGSPLTLALNC